MCKDVLWKWWSCEYFVVFWEWYNLKYEGYVIFLCKGDVVIIKDDDCNWNKWKFGIIEDLIVGRDGIVWVVKLWVRKVILERVI